MQTKSYIFSFLFIILLTSRLLPQNASYFYSESIGNFKEASDFYISPSGLIFVTDTGNDVVIQIDTLGKIIKSTGGYGWSDNSFDDPISIFVNPLYAYVSDHHNHKIKKFDRSLNLLSVFNGKESNFQEEQFGYPLGAVVSSKGDLFILDGENSRIVKFDYFGNYSGSFGGFNSEGEPLIKPSKISVTSEDNILVLDRNKLRVYDGFGNTLYSFERNNLVDIKPASKSTILISPNQITFTGLNISEPEIIEPVLIDIPQNSEFISAMLLTGKLYIL
ncbi:MAG: NHL repeat-containing protein, partial [Ignavibacteriaceae bacterium]|nr:NHL repeat-containing protein [Ignavibacteriaceae bacterium]